MAQNNISIAQARGNFLTWCISGYMPLAELCRPLFFGQQLDGAEGIPGEFYIMYSAEEAADFFGPGSIISLMARVHFDCCPELPLYLSPLPEPAGTKATHTMTVSGPATDTDVLSFTVMDHAFEVPILSGADADEIAEGIAAVLNANAMMPFEAVAAGPVVTLTAKNVGPTGNWFVPIFNPNFGERIPEGVSIDVARGVNGTAVFDPVPVEKPFACPWDCVALGVENATLVNTIIRLLRINWKCGVQGNFKDGHLFHSRTDTAGQIAAYARTRNNAEECIVPVRGSAANVGIYKYPGYLMAAAFASRVCCTACVDPSRPIQYDNGLLCGLYDSRPCSSVWTPPEKRAFYDAGVSNWDVWNWRGIRETALVIEEPLTTWKFDPNTGAPDGAWQRVEYRYTVSKFVRDLGYWYKRNYSSVSLMSDGTRIPPGKRAVTPRIMQASILAWMRGTQVGWTVEDIGRLERMVQVQRENTPQSCDPNRLSVMIDIDLVNQLARIATTLDTSPEWSCIPPVLLPGQV